MVWKKNIVFSKDEKYLGIREDESGVNQPGFGSILPDTKKRFIWDCISYDRDNIPIWFAGRDGLELDEQETADMLLRRSEFSHTPTQRTIPHERIALITDRDDTRSADEIFHESCQKLKDEGDLEPCLALLDKSNNVRGEVPLHIYMERFGVDRIADLVDAGRLSFTYSGLPEAIYRRLEDGMDKGRDAYAGTINGEAEYSINKNMSLTVTNFLRSDNVHVAEESHSAEMEAALSETEEEKNDRECYYTGDYQGWYDPEYEADDDMVISDY